MGRVLGLDVGDKRIGVALSDPTHLIASPHSVYTRVGWGKDSRHFFSLCQEKDVEKIVVGLPRNMDGSEGFQADKVRGFTDKLEALGLTVIFWDERLSTAHAEHALLEGGLHRDERKHVIDQIAAALILQSYLDANKQ